MHRAYIVRQLLMQDLTTRRHHFSPILGTQRVRRNSRAAIPVPAMAVGSRLTWDHTRLIPILRASRTTTVSLVVRTWSRSIAMGRSSMYTSDTQGKSHGEL